jgi:hypothetical protein
MLNSNSAGADTAEQSSHDAGSASSGNVLMARALMSATGVCTDLHQSCHDERLDTALHCCEKKGHSAIIAQLIAARSNNDLPTTTSGANPIFAAAENGHVHVVAQLIAGRCNVNLARTTDGATPFLRAAEKRHCCGEPWHAHDRAL